MCHQKRSSQRRWRQTDESWVFSAEFLVRDSIYRARYARPFVSVSVCHNRGSVRISGQNLSAKTTVWWKYHLLTSTIFHWYTSDRRTGESVKARCVICYRALKTVEVRMIKFSPYSKWWTRITFVRGYVENVRVGDICITISFDFQLTLSARYKSFSHYINVQYEVTYVL